MMPLVNAIAGATIFGFMLEGYWSIEEIHPTFAHWSMVGLFVVLILNLARLGNKKRGDR